MPQQPSFRADRVNELIKRELTMLLSTGTKDPRLQGVFITDVIVSRDLTSAKVFFSVDDAVNLIDQALRLKDKLNGKILSAEMKSAKMIDFLKVWVKKFGGKYRIIQSRKGDRLDEYLIGEDELKFAKEMKIKKKN